MQLNNQIHYSKIKIDEVYRNDEDRWDILLLNAINGSYRQTMAWEYARVNNLRNVNTFIFSINDQDIVGAHYSIKKSMFNIIRTADILSGYIFIVEPTQELYEFLITHFLAWAKKKKASYTRVNFWQPRIIAGKETNRSYLIKSVMDNYKFESIEAGKHTYWIDVSQPEDQLLATMKRQTRYEVRKGLKSPIEMKIYDTFDNDKFNLFWDLYSSLGNQKDFEILSYEQFEKVVKEMIEAKLAVLIFAYYGKHIINVTIASVFGEGAYIYGAMNPEFKELENCPSPGPVAQWEMMMLMKSKELKIYDMGFCPGPVPIQDDPRYNIWRFKYGFGGDHIEFLPVFGKSLAPIRGKIFQFLKYKKILYNE